MQEDYAPNTVYYSYLVKFLLFSQLYEYTIRLAIPARLNVNEVFGTGVDGRHDVESVFCCAAVPVWLIVCGVTLLLLHRLF